MEEKYINLSMRRSNYFPIPPLSHTHSRRYVMHWFETQAKESRLQQQDSGLLGHASAIEIMRIKFIELLLLASACCPSASILLHLRHSCFLEERCQ